MTRDAGNPDPGADVDQGVTERAWGPRDPNHPYWAAPRGVWLAAPGQPPLAKPYPCRCTRKECDPRWCPCAGRLDLHNLPDTCCAHHNTPDVVAEAKRKVTARNKETVTAEVSTP